MSTIAQEQSLIHFALPVYRSAAFITGAFFRLGNLCQQMLVECISHVLVNAVLSHHSMQLPLWVHNSGYLQSAHLVSDNGDCRYFQADVKTIVVWYK